MSTEIQPIAKVLDSSYESKSVRIRGWIYRTRSSGKIAFVQVRDASGIIQVIVGQVDVPATAFESACKALIESSVIVEGTIHADSRAPGGFELHATDFSVVGYADIFPITKDKSEEHLLNNRHLWLRSQDLTAAMKIKATLLGAARDWFRENGFYEVTPPIITTNACEGGTTLFSFKYFDENAYLSQSAQLYLESLIFSLEKVWSLTPSFRAEKSRTTRHLTEYWHLEEEAAWLGLEESLKIQESMVEYMVHRVAELNPKELKHLGRDPKELEKIHVPFERIPYEKVIEILNEKGFQLNWGSDLGTVEERALTLDRDNPIFITNFPKEIKAFYMRENPADPRTYLCADMLAPEGYGEIIGGSERETSYDKLIERLQKDGIDLSAYEWYLDLRKFGSVQHSGFGLGIERVMRWICKLEHIRDAVPFPRTINRVYP